MKSMEKTADSPKRVCCFCVYENISLTNLKCLHIITKDNY